MEERTTGPKSHERRWHPVVAAQPGRVRSRSPRHTHLVQLAYLTVQELPKEALPKASDKEISIKQIPVASDSGTGQTSGAHLHLCQTTLDYDVFEISSLCPDDGGIYV